MSGSADWKIFICDSTLSRAGSRHQVIFKQELAVCLHYLCLHIILLYCLTWSTAASAQSWEAQINDAKDRQYSDQEQIDNLTHLLPALTDGGHQDTLGFVYYFIAWRRHYLSQHEDAIEAASSCISLFSASGYEGYRLPNVYMLRANQYKALRRYDLAKADAELIAQLPLTGEGIEMLGESIKFISQIYSERGEYQSAIAQLEHTLSSDIRDSLTAFSLATMYYDLSLAYSNFSDTISFQKATAAIRQSDAYVPLLEYEDERLNQRIINGLQSGNIAFRNQEVAAAADHYERARALIPKDNRSIELHSYYETLTANLIYAYELLHQPEKVDYTIERMDVLPYQDLPEALVEYRSLVYENIASYHRRSQRIAQAEIYLDSFYQVLDFDLGGIFTPQVIQALPLKQRLIKGLLEYIQLLRLRSDQREDKQDALRMMQLMDQLIDGVNQDLLFESSILQWRKEAQAFYQVGIDLAFQSGDHDAFWIYAEKSKSLALLDGISNNTLFSEQDFPAESVVRLRQLKLEEAELIEDPNPSDGTQIALVSNRAQQSDLLRKRDAIIKKKIPNVVNLDEIKKQYADKSIIQYAAGNESMYAIHIAGGVTELVRIAPEVELQESAQAAFRLISRLSESNVDITAAKEISKRLFQKLLSPFNLKESIVVIPEGHLSFVPFEALINEHDRFLLYDHEFSTQLSGTMYHRLQERQSSDMDNAYIIRPYYASGQFQQLHFMTDEVAQVQSATHADVIEAEVTSKPDLYRVLREADLLHFSGHAVVVAGAEDSYLAISDSLRLTEREIYQQPNQISLVTLSACETGQGELLVGEGISNLTRGFIYAGAASVVQSQWQVNDGSSTELMKFFYTNLRRGQPKSTALRNAKLSFIQTADDFQRLPYYWSAFTLVGSDAPITMSQSNSLVDLIPLIILGLCFIGYLAYMKYS